MFHAVFLISNELFKKPGKLLPPALLNYMVAPAGQISNKILLFFKQLYEQLPDAHIYNLLK
jgi:hypothetical protein